MSEFRKDPITGRWVIIASGRAKRPRQLGASSDQAHAEPCPFCAGNEALTPAEIWADRTSTSQPNQPGWSVRVVPNKYPAVSSDGAFSKPEDGISESIPGIGAHEVVIECPDHVTNLGSLNEAQLVRIFMAYRERARSLAVDGRWRYVLIYKNQGERAGATLEHLHSQIIALPQVPKEAVDEVNGARAQFESTGRCFYCSMVEDELREQKRLVLDHERFAAICPSAPRFAYETWIIPKLHREAFEQSSEQEIDGLANIVKDIVTRLNRALDNPPFNFFIHSLPIGGAPADYYHWHLEILPQLTRPAGFEWGSGWHINSVTPEDAAGLLGGVTI